MNMTPKGYLFFDNCGDCEETIASSLAEATGNLPEDFVHESYEEHTLYQVAKMNEDGTWDILGSYWEEEDAEDALDEYSDQYPNAHVDVLYGGKIQWLRFPFLPLILR